MSVCAWSESEAVASKAKTAGRSGAGLGQNLQMIMVEKLMTGREEQIGYLCGAYQIRIGEINPHTLWTVKGIPITTLRHGGQRGGMELQRHAEPPFCFRVVREVRGSI